jgi:hypothetical protein
VSLFGIVTSASVKVPAAVGVNLMVKDIELPAASVVAVKAPPSEKRGESVPVMVMVERSRSAVPLFSMVNVTVEDDPTVIVPNGYGPPPEKIWDETI